LLFSLVGEPDVVHRDRVPDVRHTITDAEQQRIVDGDLRLDLAPVLLDCSPAVVDRLDARSVDNHEPVRDDSTEQRDHDEHGDSRFPPEGHR